MYLEMYLASEKILKNVFDFQDDLPRNKSNDCRWCTGLHSEIGHEQLANKSPQFENHNSRTTILGPQFKDYNVKSTI